MSNSRSMSLVPTRLASSTRITPPRAASCISRVLEEPGHAWRPSQIPPPSAGRLDSRRWIGAIAATGLAGFGQRLADLLLQRRLARAGRPADDRHRDRASPGHAGRPPSARR